MGNPGGEKKQVVPAGMMKAFMSSLPFFGETNRFNFDEKCANLQDEDTAADRPLISLELSQKQLGDLASKKVK